MGFRGPNGPTQLTWKSATHRSAPSWANSRDTGSEEIGLEKRRFPNLSANLREEQESNYP